MFLTKIMYIFTAVLVALTSAVIDLPPPPVFRADHAFFFGLIKDQDLILFSGRFSKPNP